MDSIKLKLDEDLSQVDNVVYESSNLDSIVYSSPNLKVSSGSSLKLDVTKILEYSKKISEIGRGFNKMTAPLYIRDFSIAYDITSNMLFEVIRQNLKADNELQIAESIAYLENAAAYLESKNIKDTAEARKRYVPLDPAVRIAMDVKAESDALCSFLKTKLHEFKTAIESVKKIAYGDQFMSPDEDR